MINNGSTMEAGTQSNHDEAQSVDGSKSNHRDSQGNRNVAINIGNEHFTGLQGNGMNGDTNRDGTGASLPNHNAFGNNNVADGSFGPGNGRGRRRRRNRQRSRGSSRRSRSRGRGRGRSRSNSEIAPTASGDLNQQSDAIFNSAFGSGRRGREGMGQRSSRRERFRRSRDTRGNNGNGNYYYYRRQLGMRGRGSGNDGAMNWQFGQPRGGGAQSTFGTNGRSGDWTRRGRGGSGRRSASNMSGTRPVSNAQTNPWSINGNNNGEFGFGNFNRNGFGGGGRRQQGFGGGGGRRQQQRYRSRSQGSQFGSNRPNMPPFTLK